MIDDTQGDIIEEISDILDDSGLYLEDMIEPTVFVLTDLIAQLNDYKYHDGLVDGVTSLIKSGVEAHCLISAEQANIALN